VVAPDYFEVYTRNPTPYRDWYFVAEQAAPSPLFAHPEGCEFWICTRNRTPYTLNATTYTMHPTPQTPNRKPQTPNPKPHTLHPEPPTPDPKPQTPNPQISKPKPHTRTPNLNHQTPNRKARTPNPPAGIRGRAREEGQRTPFHQRPYPQGPSRVISIRPPD